MKNLITKFVIASVALSSTAQALPATVKDWTLSEVGNFCVASTEQKVNEQVFRLELVYEKSGQLPVEALIREVPEVSNALAIKMATEIKPVQSYAFVPMANADGNRVFWQVPKNTEALIAYIKRQTRLSMKIINSDNTISVLLFSLRGSSATVDALIKECAQGKAIVASTFDKDFIPVKAVDQLDPLKVNEARSIILRDLYLGGHQSYGQKAVLQKELSALNTRYTSLVQELAKLTGQLDQMTQKELIALQNQKTSLEAKVVKLDQDIAKQKDLVKAKESELPAANLAYEQAAYEVSKIKPEYDRLVRAVNSASANLESDEDRAATLAAEVSGKERSLEILEVELQNLNQQRQQAESQIYEYRRFAQDVEQMVRRFDTSRETQSRVDSHPVFRYCSRNSGGNCSRLISNIQSEARYEVSTLYDVVRDNSNWIRSALSEKESVISNLDYQIRDKQNYTIPKVRSELYSLRDSKDQVDRRVRNSRAELDSQRSALSQYKSRVGWDTKKANLDAKTAVVVKIQKQIDALEAEQASFEKSKTKATADLANTEKAIGTLLAKIKAGQDRSSEINKALEPYLVDKKNLETQIAIVDGAYQQFKINFAVELGK